MYKPEATFLDCRKAKSVCSIQNVVCLNNRKRLPTGSNKYQLIDLSMYYNWYLRSRNFSIDHKKWGFHKMAKSISTEVVVSVGWATTWFWKDTKHAPRLSYLFALIQTSRITWKLWISYLYRNIGWVWIWTKSIG